MPFFNQDTLAQDTQGQWHGTSVSVKVNSFAYDTRLLKPGSAFLAIRTDNRDGHDFLAEAKAKGALAAIVQQPRSEVDLPQLVVPDTLKAFHQIATAHRNRFSGKVIGVTGSCGKTTTKNWITNLLGSAHVCATSANLNNLIGVPITVTSIDPDSHNFAVVEAGMNMRGEMSQLASIIQPDIAVITNVAPVHLEKVGTLHDVAEQKAALALHSPATSIVLFPESCLQFNAFQSFGNRARILVKGKSSVAGYSPDQVIAYSYTETDSSTTLSFSINTEELTFHLPTLSEGMITNAALSITVALLNNIAPELINQRISDWKPAEHRGEQFTHEGQYYFVDCYNANPIAMQDALGLFQKITDPSQPRVYVLGSMGELGPHSPEFHFEVGKSIVLNESDQLILIGKDAQPYKEGCLAQGFSESQIHCCVDKEEAREPLSKLSGNVFLKGSKVYELWELVPKNAQRIERKTSIC